LSGLLLDINACLTTKTAAGSDVPGPAVAADEDDAGEPGHRDGY
jgi:hypothetical protein